ncbi:MAG: hypothetical protein JO201_04230 [Verrucomicrobia bacterium]|nr:hypothetical protein [Verrucomicrobiota bacterium]
MHCFKALRAQRLQTAEFPAEAKDGNEDKTEKRRTSIHRHVGENASFDWEAGDQTDKRKLDRESNENNPPCKKSPGEEKLRKSDVGERHNEQRVYLAPAVGGNYSFTTATKSFRRKRNEFLLLLVDHPCDHRLEHCRAVFILRYPLEL